MPIFTECPSCDEPLMVNLARDLVGSYIPHDCDECGETMVLEMSRMGGRTYDEEWFVEEVLPDLEKIDRIDHPTEDLYVYGSESVQTREVDGDE